MKTAITALTLFAATATASAAPFSLASPDFKNGGAIADKYAFNSFGCTGDNVAPALTWSNVPAGTKSFALVVHDPDAPTGGAGWVHWVVYNIPADATSLPEGGGLPTGATQSNTDFGKPGWGGPCPPAGSGDHHYNFTLYALKVDHLELPAGATPGFVGFNVNGNALGKAKLTGIYNRKH